MATAPSSADELIRGEYAFLAALSVNACIVTSL